MINLVVATPKKETEELLVDKFSKRVSSFEDYNYQINTVYENIEGLSKVYNCFLTEDFRGDIVVFMHDDVDILDLYFASHLKEALSKYDIVGLAGVGGPIQIKSPTGWHLMGKRENFSGAVYHTNGEQSWSSSFGVMPKQVILIDGLFMAINVTKALERGFKFDEDFTFHHYDLAACLVANQCGMKVGVVNIPVLHYGLGDGIQTPEWEESDRGFVKKYKNFKIKELQ